MSGVSPVEEWNGRRFQWQCWCGHPRENHINGLNCEGCSEHCDEFEDGHAEWVDIGPSLDKP